MKKRQFIYPWGLRMDHLVICLNKLDLVLAPFFFLSPHSSATTTIFHHLHVSCHFDVSTTTTTSILTCLLTHTTANNDTNMSFFLLSFLSLLFQKLITTIYRHPPLPPPHFPLDMSANHQQVSMTRWLAFLLHLQQ